MITIVYPAFSELEEYCNLRSKSTTKLTDWLLTDSSLRKRPLWKQFFFPAPNQFPLPEVDNRVCGVTEVGKDKILLLLVECLNGDSSFIWKLETQVTQLGLCPPEEPLDPSC